MKTKIKIEKGKLYLITGATGFLGKQLTKAVLERGGKVRALSRNEGKLISLKQEFPEVETYPGDVSDPFEIHQAFNGVTGVFHLAASKHVGLAEKFCRECVKTNVLGTINILEESLKNKPKFVLGISTDKAAQVSGVYGASKLLMERLFKQYEKLNSDTKYRIVRYGNVLYSTGSVLCKWKELIKGSKQVIVTDPSATRFFWTVDEAISLIFECMEKSTNSNPFVPDMKSMKIGDLLEAMRRKYSASNASLNIKTIGLQEGENLHEKVRDEGPYSNEVEQYTIEEIMEKI
jgi:UDP-N-acetylglucosamine 4,6-dehydratase|tara:strand:+ start:324 stop:1193 length:870 start_codon:yes stop_codon:yes gene_type:complete